MPKPSAPEQRLWHRHDPVPSAPRPGPSRWKVFLAGIVVSAGIGAAVALLLPLVRPLTGPYFVPLVVTDYPNPSWPQPKWTGQDREALRTSGLFPRTRPEAFTAQSGQQLRRELAALALVPPEQPVVVYLSALALREGPGRVCILPADASPDEPETWLPLREVLERFRDCPARQRLLILDLAQPVADPWLGILANDVPRGIVAELLGVEDPHRLVLAACSPGQTALASPELGRSVFSFYLEEGLRGHADGSVGSAHVDGEVSVSELAAFVRQRVDRWARLNRGVRQTPLFLGNGPDFTLTNPGTDQALAWLPDASPLAYPDWLQAGWQQRDQWWKAGNHRLVPRGFQVGQALLCKAERDLAGGKDPGSLKKNLETWKRLESELDREQKALPLNAVSLAQVAIDAKALAAGQEALARLFSRLQKQLAARPEEIEAIQGQFAVEFTAQSKDLPDSVVAAAVWHQALVSPKPSPRTIIFLESLLQPANLPPRFAEILTLYQIAELARWSNSSNWPAEAVGRLLQVTHTGEQIAHCPRVFPWLQGLLEEAAQERYEGEVRLLSPGFISSTEGDRLLQSAATHFATAQAQGHRLEQALDTLEEAWVVLPILGPCLEDDSEKMAAWTLGVQAACDLASALKLPDPSAPRHWSSVRLMDQIEKIEQATQALRETLNDLNLPFQADNVNRLKILAEGPADVGVYRQIEALLGVPHPALSASQRKMLFQASRQLARRLHEDTRGRDRQDAKTTPVVGPPEVLDLDQSQAQEGNRAIQRSRLALGLCDLAGLTKACLAPARQAINDACRQPPATATWYAARSPLRGAFTQDLLQQFQEDPAERERLGWFLPPHESLPMDHEDVSPTRALRADRLRLLLSWQGDRYRYQARDYREAGFRQSSSLVAREFYLHAADANPTFAVPRPEGYVQIRTIQPVPRLTTKAPFASLGLEVQRNVPPGEYGALQLTFSSPNPYWLKVTPDAVSLPRLSKSAEPRNLASRVPIELHYMPVPNQADFAVIRPRGILASARLEGRSFHSLVPVPMQLTSSDLQVLLSSNPKSPENPLEEIRLQPGKDRQSFFLHVKNPTSQTRKVVVEVKVGDEFVPIWWLPVTLAPGEVRRVAPDKSEPGSDKLPAFSAPLQLTLFDGDHPGQVLDARMIPVTVGQPAPGDRPAIRLQVPARVAAGNKLKFPVLVDNAPPGSGLEVALGRKNELGGFLTEKTFTFPTAGHQAIGFAADGNALTFASASTDWTVELDTRKYQGFYLLRAWLRDQSGKALAEAEVPVIIDGTPPEKVTLVNLPAKVVTGAHLNLRSQAEDAETGIATVQFFLGRPLEGQLPANAPVVSALPTEGAGPIWGGSLPLSGDRRGPTPVSVKVTNQVGLVRFVTFVVEVVDAEPAPPTTGQIEGKVLEGNRPQPNLEVILRDDQNIEKGRVKTQADGTFRFDRVPPGRYRVFCLKPESQRRAMQPALMEAGQTIRVMLELLL